SAVALTGRSTDFKTSSRTTESAGTSAPGQRRGRNAEIGVIGRTFAFSGKIGPPAEELYAVEPTGVETMTPSHTSSSIRTLPFTWTRIFAELWVSRIIETSLNAVSLCFLPCLSVTDISSG